MWGKRLNGRNLTAAVCNITRLGDTRLALVILLLGRLPRVNLAGCRVRRIRVAVVLYAVGRVRLSVAIVQILGTRVGSGR